METLAKVCYIKGHSGSKELWIESVHGLVLHWVLLTSPDSCFCKVPLVTNHVIAFCDHKLLCIRMINDNSVLMLKELEFGISIRFRM